MLTRNYLQYMISIVGAPRKSVTGRSLPSARRISTVMQSLDTRKSRVHTHLLVIFGQYLAHDLTDTPTTVRRRFGGKHLFISYLILNKKSIQILDLISSNNKTKKYTDTFCQGKQTSFIFT